MVRQVSNLHRAIKPAALAVAVLAVADGQHLGMDMLSAVVAGESAVDATRLLVQTQLLRRALSAIKPE